MQRVRYSRRSLSDLEVIGDFIAQDNPVAARKTLRAIKDKCRDLAETPMIGSQRDEFGQGIRTIVVGHYVVFYRPEPFGITVARVLHGARNLRKLF